MLRCVDLVRTGFSEERVSSIVIIERISDLGTTKTKLTSLLRNVIQLLVTANIVPSSLILVTLMIEALRSSEMSVLTRATPCHIPEDGIFHLNFVTVVHEFQPSNMYERPATLPVVSPTAHNLQPFA
jgi:hypothetical protein